MQHNLDHIICKIFREIKPRDICLWYHPTVSLSFILVGPSRQSTKFLSLATEQDGWFLNWTWWFSSQSFLDSFTIKTTSRVSSGWRNFVGNRTFFYHLENGSFLHFSFRFLLLQQPSCKSRMERRSKSRGKIQNQMSGHSSESQRQGAPPGLWAAEWRGELWQGCSRSQITM